MRTTVNIDEHLLARAKQKAREQGKTLGQYAEDLFRRDVNGAGEKEEAPEIPLYDGEGGVAPEAIFTSNRDLYEFLDRGVPLEKIRW
ncbi:MAG: hypothetical protein M9938_07425 [Solirubrobacterales bacterium]|nr:hypothetical protein [Solirubrobacterales bacterium]